MHALSLGTWWIHLTTLFEWSLAIVLIMRWSIDTENPKMRWLSLAMLPNLASAMAAITWHIYDNAEVLKGLVVLQSALTVIGNCCLAAAALHLSVSKAERSESL